MIFAPEMLDLAQCLLTYKAIACKASEPVAPTIILVGSFAQPESQASGNPIGGGTVSVDCAVTPDSGGGSSLIELTLFLPLTLER